MSDINWKDLPKDLEKILEKNDFLKINYSVNEFTWASGDSKYEVSYDVIAEKGNCWRFDETYILDKGDGDDGYGLANSNLSTLRHKMSKKGYLTDMRDNSLKINAKLI